MHAGIVGGGIYGLAVAWALLRQGHRVTLVDRAPSLPAPLGSSTDQHRLIRHAYGAEAGYTRMVTDAFPAWDALWADLGQRLYAETGTLALGHAGADGFVATTEAVLRDQAIPHERLSPAEAARHFPVYACERAAAALWATEGGTLFAADIVAALAAHLTERGAALHLRRSVASIDTAAPSLTLDDGTVLRADLLVVAAGAWTAQLLHDLATSLQPVLQTLVYLEPQPSAAWDQAPMLLAELTADGSFYTVPPRAGRGLKVGLHTRSGASDPDGPRAPPQSAIDATRAILPDYFADAQSYRIASATTCLYTVAPGERFVTQRRDRTLLLSCCSGHGFKFAPLVGLEVARLLDGATGFEAFAAWLAGIGARPASRVSSSVAAS